MTQKRAGVEAAVRLSRSRDAQLWTDIEGQFPSLVESRDDESDLQKERKSNLQQQELFYGDFTDNIKTGKVKFLTRKSLTNIVNWKFAVGKKRPYSVSGNSDEAIKKHSQIAIGMAKKVDVGTLTHKSKGEDFNELNQQVEAAMKELMELKGVGPATASAILSMVNPNVFCYMYDETIDCFEKQRKYDIKCYLRVNRECFILASTLGNGWTANRVARTLWVAARLCADPNCTDLTAAMTTAQKSKRTTAQVPDEPEVPATKRRRRR